ncbi:MAG: hypothetical protein BHW38_00450 [Firmicutes bacterium CAG:321_26_22]|nr:MAG: hypothetical protein BHW38_00450 [Firmicutes bacterium CAG:321_26_22]
MKLNRKGYLTVEIILASAVAFAIAFFLMEITVKLVSKTDDVYHETVITYDDAIMINNIKDKIIDYIIETDGLALVECKNNECNIWGERVGGATEERYLYYDSESKEIRFSEGAEEGKDRVTLYAKKVDDSISEVEISSNINRNVKPSDRIVFFNIKLKNIFTDNAYEMVIPINLTKKVEEVATIYLFMSGRRGEMSTTISFDKKQSNGYNVDLHANYDQLFESSQSTTLMACYLDKEKKNVYNFNSLGTMRYQGYYLEITNGIPNTLYCEFYEDH